ncbi:MAG: hypothetical protein ACKO96_01555, partial [Flammeovirgaceae bacterium]
MLTIKQARGNGTKRRMAKWPSVLFLTAFAVKKQSFPDLRAPKRHIACVHCQQACVKKGHKNGVQTYRCKGCKKYQR